MSLSNKFLTIFVLPRYYYCFLFIIVLPEYSNTLKRLFYGYNLATLFLYNLSSI